MLEVDVPQMDLGNHKPKLFGLKYRQLLFFAIAAVLLWLVLSHNWGKSINWYMPWIILICTPAVYFSSVEPFGYKPEKFLAIWIRYTFLTKETRPYLSSLQKKEASSIGESLNSAISNSGKSTKKEPEVKTEKRTTGRTNDIYDIFED